MQRLKVGDDAGIQMFGEPWVDCHNPMYSTEKVFLLTVGAGGMLAKLKDWENIE